MVRQAHALLPTDLIVVYNKNMPESMDVARYYALKRGVSESHLVGVDAPESESVDRVYYDTQIIPPIRAAVKKLRLTSQSPSILLVFGIPLRIEDTSETKLYKQYEDLTINKVEEYKKLVLQQGEQLEKLINNGEITTLLYNKENRESLETMDIIKSVSGTIIKAMEYLKKHVPVEAERENYSKVVSLLFRMAGMAPFVNDVKNIVASMDTEERILLLRNNNLLKFNAVLNNQYAEFQFWGCTPEKALDVSTTVRMVNGVIGELLFWEKLQRNSKIEETSASVDSELTLVLAENFQLSRWLLNPLMKDYSRLTGIEFMRRKTIMVGRLDAPTPDMAKRLVDDAIETEKNGLTGTLYIDARGLHDKGDQDIYSRYDESLLRLHRLAESKCSLNVVLENSRELFGEKSCPDAALYVGWYSLAKYVDSFGWKTGSVGFHIASAEATTLKRPDSKVWCKRMIEEGVAATLGPVNEPYLASFPLPDVFFPLLMTGRLTLLETYYRSLPYISWRLVLIGDPLYNPFKNNPVLDIDSL